jgi:hypothetical protein
MEAYWGVEVQLYALSTVALDAGEWLTSRTGRFTPRERAPGTHWIGGCVGTGTGLDAVVNQKFPSLCRDWNPALYHGTKFGSRLLD